jgi:hypothetical protein
MLQPTSGNREFRYMRGDPVREDGGLDAGS